MRKWILLILTTCWGLSSLQANGAGPLWRSWYQTTFTSPSGITRTLNFNLSRQLNIRLAESYKQALALYDQLPEEQFVLIGEPIKRSAHTQDLDPQKIYPELPFLQTSQQTGNLISARSNRLYKTEATKVEGLWQNIERCLPQFEKKARELKQPENASQWLAQTLPDNTLDFFMGEIHGHPEIRQAVSETITYLHQRFPTRPIFLFTEFLPSQHQWNNQTSPQEIPAFLSSYFPIWERATQQHIPVIGLEPDFALPSKALMHHIGPDRRIFWQSIWASLEGVRLRNAHFAKILEQYRQNYPTALFIIYTGAAHVFYNYPFSLSAKREKGSTFVATFHPNVSERMNYSKRIAEQEITTQTGPLEKFAPLIAFPQPVLYWEDNDLIQTSGFNVRLKIKVDLNQKDK